MRVCSLFSGIGGFEVGLRRAGFDVVLACENDPAAVAVLSNRFSNLSIHRNVETLSSLPNCDLVTAGWPCQDLSQAGAVAGHEGSRSGLVKHVFRLLGRARKKPAYILLENVAFSLHLHRGVAIREVTKNLEDLGYNWAYRVLDTQYFGLPQRRRRVFILGALHEKPEAVLFDGNAESSNSDHPLQVGFYWTEGNRGVGWTPNAVPPLKGGSGLSIPSPPAIWDRSTKTFFSPGVRDAERLQGFRRGWTSSVVAAGLHDRVRWRLIGNAVSVPVASWIGQRLASPRRKSPDLHELTRTQRRANFGWGGPGSQVVETHLSIEGPRKPKFSSIAEFGFEDATPLSKRAAAGFLQRLVSSPLRVEDEFIKDLAAYCDRYDLIEDRAA
ncbi:DNA cytosine methyltransferase [Bradyrhizobium sp. SZCCHNS2015]|uniref:DNA cytosine methyltransferase n=1 Tax=Bradyrhizobium sp. SZCCHNS2015 TaxID=3057305 RepID=UPI0039655ED7